MRIFLAITASLLATTVHAQTPTSVEGATSDLESCLRANVSLDTAKADGAAAAAEAALGKCETEVGKLDRAIARASKAAGKTVTQNKAATDAAHARILSDVEAFIARNLTQERGD